MTDSAGSEVISADPVEDDIPDTARMLPLPEDSSGGGRQQRQHTTVNVNNDYDGEEVIRDNAVGAEAQNLLNMQNEIARPMSFLGFLRYHSLRPFYRYQIMQYSHHIFIYIIPSYIIIQSHILMLIIY